MKYRIGIDVRMMRHSGIGTYLRGLLDGLSGDAVKKYRAEILEFMKVEESEVLDDLMSTKKLAAGSKEKFLEAIKKYFVNQPKAE